MTSRPDTRHSRFARAALLALLLLRPASAPAQIGTAPTGDPGGFGINGELESNVVGRTDWCEGSGGNFLIFNNGLPVNSSTIHGVDGFNNSDPIFISSRLYDDPNTVWSWDSPGQMDQLGGKESLNHGLGHFSRDAAAHTWFTWSMDRRGAGGQSYFQVSLMQGSLVPNFNNTFTSSGPHGGHTVGDVVLALELLDANGVPILTAWRWTEVAPGLYDLSALTLPAGAHFTASNAGFQATVPYTAFGDGWYPPETFAEASIDLSALLAGFPPPTFRTVLFSGRFGGMIQSLLRDFIDPLALTIPTGVEPSVPRRAGLLGLSPNPGRGPVTVEFVLATVGEAALEVFDVAGRRVGDRVTGTFGAGRHALRWTPPADARARGGLYFARLAAGGATDERRFIVLP